MIPTFITLHIYKGQTFNENLTFYNPDNTVINLTGRTALMHIRQEVESPEVILELSTALGTISMSALGVLAFNVPATVTAALPSGHDYAQWVYDLEWTLPSGVVERPIQGAVIVWPEVTRT